MPWRRSFGDNLVYTDWQRDNYEHAIATVLANARRQHRAGSASRTTTLPGLLRAKVAGASPAWNSWTSPRP